MKAKRKGGMSRRRFLQLGIATTTASISAVIAARWMTQSPQARPPEVSNCSYSWGPNKTRINEDNSVLLQEALIADGLTPARVEVYDRAMEYQTCFDAEGNIISNDLLYRQNESAMVAFTAGDTSLSADRHRSLVEDVIDTLTRIEAFSLQDLDVQLSNGDESLIWQASIYQAQSATAEDVYSLGRS